MKRLFVIFVNFNSGRQLYDGVLAVSKLKSVHQIIIVDNGSSDDSLKQVEKIGIRVEIIKNSKNIGFYKAINMGINKSLKMGAEMVMPLDFDLDFSSDFISKLLSVEADIVAPVLKFKRNGDWVYDYGGRINWFLGRSTHLEKNGPLALENFSKFAGDRSTQNSYDFVSGGCTIFKKKVFEKIGLFDEDYFVYYGDTDYSLKAARNGFKVVLDPNTIVHHKLEITKQTKNIRKLKIAWMDNLTFVNKWIRWYIKPLAYSYLIILSLKIWANLYL